MRRLWLVSAMFSSTVLLWVMPAEAAPGTCGGRTITILGTAGNDVLHGTRRADVIAGLGGNDTVNGREGNDTICGGAGADQVRGNAGADRLFGGIDYRADSHHRRGDILAGGPGDDLIVPGRDDRSIEGAAVPDRVSWRTAGRGVSLTMPTGIATGQGRDRILGHAYRPLLSDHADRVVGTEWDDVIETFAGSDTVWGGEGHDTIFADDPNASRPATGPSLDLVRGGGGRDWIIGREGADRLMGGGSDDQIEDRGRSSDVLVGGRGSDRLEDKAFGGPDELLSGGGAPGRDSLGITNGVTDGSRGRIDLAAETLRIQGVPGTGTVRGFAGGLDLFSSGRPWTVIGSVADDWVAAPWSHHVAFTGAAGDDRLLDGGRDDYFAGGAGVDTMVTNQGGVDTCVAVETNPEFCEIINP